MAGMRLVLRCCCGTTTPSGPTYNRLTEASDRRVTEAGEPRVTEDAA